MRVVPAGGFSSCVDHHLRTCERVYGQSIGEIGRNPVPDVRILRMRATTDPANGVKRPGHLGAEKSARPSQDYAWR